MRRTFVQVAMVCWMSLTVWPVAQAQFAVVDVGAITQLLAQVRLLQQQLLTARNELTQAQTEFQSITGGRGMEQLLAGTVRNYLPSQWSQLAQALQGTSGTYGALAAALQGVINGSLVLSGPQLALLSPAAQQQITFGRSSAATFQVVSQQALAVTSDRFTALQKLIDAIPSAWDQKGALDLQARIAAELAMLQNEHTKLQTMFQAVQADQLANQQRLREQVVAGYGQFATRFQPVP
jgi:type IV secretion system protein VirB5